ncbi:AAA family ATPase, partial [Peptococcaceae bacterium]|nr:AAA family ATPase [Peptococcaceae bacterium]
MPAKLPIGIQTFKEIRTGNYIYVDKTKEAYNLINDYKYAFLARPRRFGKSLFLDTLRNIFEGNKDLFKGLYIYDKWDWNEKYPIIKIDWSGNFQTLENLEKTAMEIFEGIQENLGIKCKSDKPDGCFRELIRKAHKKYNQQVVILIDEYDKPILDVIENRGQVIKNREFLKGLYSIIKANDEHIKFCFLTGVSKFSKTSIFSGLNVLEDISLSKKYGNICGYTEQDIKEKFKEYLEDVDINEIREWYDGYWFLKDKIYNPFDVLRCLKNKEFDNYWFTSGNPSFLIKLIKERKYFLPNLSNLTIDKKLLDIFDIERMDTEALLYQAGYLTIKEAIQKRRRTVYKLGFPNYEVKSSFSEVILDYFLGIDNTRRIEIQNTIHGALVEGDVEKF